MPTLVFNNFFHDVVPVDLVMTSNKVSTLSVNCAVIPLTVMVDKPSPLADHRKEPVDLKPPPDLTNVPAADVPTVIRLLDDVFASFYLPVRKEKLKQQVF